MTAFHALPLLADFIVIGGSVLGTILVVLLILFLLKRM